MLVPTNHPGGQPAAHTVGWLRALTVFCELAVPSVVWRDSIPNLLPALKFFVVPCLLPFSFACWNSSVFAQTQMLAMSLAVLCQCIYSPTVHDYSRSCESRRQGAAACHRNLKGSLSPGLTCMRRRWWAQQRWFADSVANTTSHRPGADPAHAAPSCAPPSSPAPPPLLL